MATTDFTTSIVVDQSTREVFAAINKVRAWWSEEIEGKTDHINEVWNYHFQEAHISKIKIVEFVPDKKVVWHMIENYFSFTKNKSELTDTKVVFDIIEKDNKTHLRFTHEGLLSDCECYDICANAWTKYIQESLFNLITKGKGSPNGKDRSQTEDEKALSSNHFTSTFFVNNKPEEVFSAIHNVRAWWSGEIKGNTENLDDEFSYQMKDVHFSIQKIIESIPNKRVVWLITDSKLKFNNTSEWTGTKIEFEISEISGKTQVRFTHIGLVPSFECYENCSWAWRELMQESLPSLITTGKGINVFE